MVSAVTYTKQAVPSTTRPPRCSLTTRQYALDTSKRRGNAVPTRATELLRVVHARPGVTRADAARLIGVGTGATTELVGRLGQAGLLAEGPTAPSGARGRPTTALIPHPRGPLIAAASITHESWRVDVVELGGSVLATAGGELAGRGGG